jgi:hypothetical protein
MILIRTQKGREVKKGALGGSGDFEIFLTDGTDDTDFHVADCNIPQEPRMALVVESMVM